jgi:hypothetical protein
MIMGLVILIILVTVVGAAGFLVSSTLREAHVPSHVARQRLRRQMIDIEAKIRSMASTVESEGEKKLAKIRALWRDARLDSVALEDLEADGVGAATYEALRAAGIQRPSQMATLGSRKIPSIGHKRKTLLLRAYQRLLLRVEAEARSVTEEELDEFSGGRLRILREESEAQRAARERQLFEVLLRRQELAKRLGRLGRT